MVASLRLLICAFGPFPGVAVNPSAELARRLVRLHRPALGDVALNLEILPTRWAALSHLSRRLAALQPDGVLLLGVAARRSMLCLETRAVNRAADRADAARQHPAGRRVLPHAPEVLQSSAAVAPLLAAARTRTPTRASRDAGRYLCNASYAVTLQQLGRRPAVFLHIPGRGGARADDLVAAASALLRVLAAQARTVRLRTCPARPDHFADEPAV